MSVYRLILDKNEPIRIRFQAFVNLFCVLYWATVTLLVTHTAYVTVLPACYSGWAVTWHRLAVGYLLVAVIGQFFTCVLTDAGVKDEHLRPFSKQTIKSKSGRTVKKEFLQTSNAETKILCDNSKQEANGRYSLEGMHLCKLCNLVVPARTHHCQLCKKCIIKRDHHCFFMGVCIGRDNHLHFIYFTLYMGIGTFYGLMLLSKYMFYMYGTRFYGPQTFISLFINTMLALLSGSIPSAMYLFVFIQLYLSLFGTTFAFSFFFWHLLIVTRGQTTYEARSGIKKFAKETRQKNILDVFRKGSCISLFVPFWDLIWSKKNSLKSA